MAPCPGGQTDSVSGPPLGAFHICGFEAPGGGGGGQEVTRLSDSLPAPSSQLALLLSLSPPLQVYVSYDYGKSFRKISEQLNFGPGNSSEAVIAQFYHSPVDNKRVRGSWDLETMTCWPLWGQAESRSRPAFFVAGRVARTILCQLESLRVESCVSNQPDTGKARCADGHSTGSRWACWPPV